MFGFLLEVCEALVWHDGIEEGQDTMGHGSRRAFFDYLMKVMMKRKGTEFRDWHRRAIPPPLPSRTCRHSPLYTSAVHNHSFPPSLLSYYTLR